MDYEPKYSHTETSFSPRNMLKHQSFQGLHPLGPTRTAPGPHQAIKVDSWTPLAKARASRSFLLYALPDLSQNNLYTPKDHTFAKPLRTTLVVFHVDVQFS